MEYNGCSLMIFNDVLLVHEFTEVEHVNSQLQLTFLKQHALEIVLDSRLSSLSE